MNRRLLWKLCLIIGAGTVVLFYALNVLTSRTEDGMSFIAEEHQSEILAWGTFAEELYNQGDHQALDEWLQQLQTEEDTWAAVIQSQMTRVGGGALNERFYEAFSLGRDVSWKIHLYFPNNPIIEVRFADQTGHFAILLPQRMRPGIYWAHTNFALQIILPMVLLTILAAVLYRHIMKPLQELRRATQSFSQGNLKVNVRNQVGNRTDEISDLIDTFDQMTVRIGELIVSQRQLIGDLSHELRTPLARMDIAISSLKDKQHILGLGRLERESALIRGLVEDTLTLAWLENERPILTGEAVNLTDLMDVLVADAEYEFADKVIKSQLPDTKDLQQTNLRALGQALENILRNAMRFTPSNGHIEVALIDGDKAFTITIKDQGPGVPDLYLEHIFAPFFRLDTAREKQTDDKEKGFGLGLALAKRQIVAVGGSLRAVNNVGSSGLTMTVSLPKAQAAHM